MPSRSAHCLEHPSDLSLFGCAALDADLCQTLHTQADDRAIKAEGLDNLTESELREACRARGIRGNVYGEGAKAFMVRQLSEWLELSLNRCAVCSTHLLDLEMSACTPPDSLHCSPVSPESNSAPGVRLRAPACDCEFTASKLTCCTPKPLANRGSSLRGTRHCLVDTHLYRYILGQAELHRRRKQHSCLFAATARWKVRHALGEAARDRGFCSMVHNY